MAGDEGHPRAWSSDQGTQDCPITRRPPGCLPTSSSPNRHRLRALTSCTCRTQVFPCEHLFLATVSYHRPASANHVKSPFYLFSSPQGAGKKACHLASTSSPRPRPHITSWTRAHPAPLHLHDAPCPSYPPALHHYYHLAIMQSPRSLPGSESRTCSTTSPDQTVLTLGSTSQNVSCFLLAVTQAVGHRHK